MSFICNLFGSCLYEAKHEVNLATKLWKTATNSVGTQMENKRLYSVSWIVFSLNASY